MSQTISVNTTLAHYRIISKIGAGGMGEVYLAQDTKLDRKVALKILPGDVAANRDRMNRFVREAKSAAALNHPNIAHIYEIGESDGTHFIAMEFIDGKTLRQKTHEERVPLSKFLKYLNQVAEGLSKAHAAGIVHRDLKPENIMITRDDYAKVLDFGLAKLVEPQRSFGSGDRGSSEIATAIIQQPGPPAGQPGWGGHQSTPGVVMGTVGYMSPEQASGRVNEIDHRSDIFSFGCILFEAATGQRPFEGKDALDSLHKIVHAPTPQLKDTNPLAPEELQRIVRRCLAKEPEKRYQSIKEVAIELDDLRQELKSQTASDSFRHARSSASVTTSGAARADEGFRVAVLPFKARDADPAVATLADGLSEEIVTGLSRFRYLSVVTSTSAVRLKGETKDALGAKLGTRYVLEGSIRKGGSLIRVSAQLVDTETGAQLWSETYNQDLQTSTVFAVQDDVAGRIVATVADSYGVLVHSMRAAIRQKDDADLTSAEWQFQYFAYREQITPSNHAALKRRLERVAERGDQPSDLWACLAQIYVDEYAFGFPGDDGKSLDRALVAARRGVELDRANQFAMVALAQTHFFRQDLAAFGPAAERAMALNPLNTDALGILGLEIVHTAEFERGTAIVRRAMELNPNHAGWMHFAPLWDHFHKGEYKQALECANRVDVPGLFWPYLVMASACGHLGRRAEAEAAVRDLLALDPEFAAHARSNVGTWHFASGLMDPILEGLRKAGLEISDDKEAAAPATDVARSSTADSGAARAQEGFWVAVLPFKYGGANADLTVLAEGISEDVVTGLSRFSYLRVIAHSSTVRYATDSGDVREIGKALGARYVMEGSLRQAGTKLRLAVQLIDATTGAHLWAENYERTFSPESVFELQDDLVPRIVSTVADQYGALVHSMSESLRGKSAGQYSAHEAVLRAFGYLERITPEEHREVREILEAAIAVTPDHSDCLAQLSLIYWHEHAHGYNVKTDPLGRAHAAAQRAVAAAPTDHLAHHALATVFFFQKDFLAFRPAAERALALNPMDASTTAFLGVLISYSGDWEYGLSLVERAMHLNPHHAGWYHFPAFHHAYHRRDYRGALEIALKINMPGYFFMHTALAAVYGQLGEQERARAALRDLHALVPDFEAMAREEYSKWLDAELTEEMMDGLRKAGLEIPDEDEMSTNSLTEARAETPPQATGPLQKPSIAVLPFANISKDPDNEYFCDGLAEELLNALAKLDELKVAARTSAFSFKGKNVNVSEIGGRLGVKNVLEGSVRRSGNRLRVTVQLVNASDGYHLWSERYDREMQDIFNVQDEITLAVVDALKLKLFGDEKAMVLKRYTDDVEAHELFLKGRYYHYKYSAEGWRRAIEFFEKAIEKEPNYAPAYAGMNTSWGFLWFMGFLPAEQAVPQMKAAAIKALEIDENLAEAHLSQAMISFFYDWEWQKAEQEFKRAIALNPHNAEALSFYSMFLGFEERFDEAISRGRRSLEIDPLSPLINMNVGWTYFSAGLLDEALDQAGKMIEIEPDFFGAYWLKGAIYLSEGKYEEAVEELKKAVSLGGHQIVLADLGSAYGLAGKKDEAAVILDQLLEMRRREHVPAICVARVYSRIGENDKAIEWLEKAFEEKNGEMVFLKGEIAGAADGDSLNSLGSDPRLIDLLRKMNVPLLTNINMTKETK